MKDVLESLEVAVNGLEQGLDVSSSRVLSLSDALRRVAYGMHYARGAYDHAQDYVDKDGEDR